MSEGQISDYVKDMIAEEQFLSVARDKVGQLSSEIELMVKVYNGQLEQMVGLRMDMDFNDHLVLAEPSNNKHAQQRSQLKEALGRKRKLIEIIRKQILEQLTDKEKKDGEKD